MQRSERGWIRSAYACLAVLFVLTIVVQGTFTVDAIRNVTGDYPARPIQIGRPWPTITGSNYGAFKKGQRVVAIDGRVPRGLLDLPNAVRIRRPGDTLPITVERDGARIDARIVLEPIIKQTTALFVVFAAIVWFLMPWLSIGLGFWVAALRAHDSRAWLVLGILLGISQMNRPGVLDPAGWPWIVAAISAVYRNVAIMAWAACMMLFGMYFPRRWRFDRKLPWLKWVLMAPLAAMAILGSVADTIALTNYTAAQSIFRIPGLPVTIIISICVALFFAGLFDKHRDRSLPPDERRRLGLLYWGCNAALTPLFLMIIYTVVTGKEPQDGPLMGLAFALVFLFPVTMAYVLVVQRAMDVRVVLRQGMQYTLARGGIKIIQVLVTLGVVIMAANLLGASTLSRPARFTLVAVGVLIVLRVREGGDRLRRWLDRRFFREAYNAEQILGELSEQVRSILHRDALLDTVARKISESLHVERIAVMLLEGGAFRPALATGYAAPLEIAIPADAPAVVRMHATREPVAAARDEFAALDAELFASAGVAQGAARVHQPWSEEIRRAIFDQRCQPAAHGRGADRPRARKQPALGGDRR